MRACWVVVPILLFAYACGNQDAPTSPSSPPKAPSYNAGTWVHESLLPSGAYSQFSLDTVAGTVRGEGYDYDVVGVADSFAVAGRLAYPSIALVFTYSTGTLGTYTAQFVSPSLLVGTFVAPGYSPKDSLRFGRQ